MAEPTFFKRSSGLTLAEIAKLTGATPAPGVPLDHLITNVASLDLAGPNDLAFFDKPKFSAVLATTFAGACLLNERVADQAPRGLNVLRSPQPYRAFVAVARTLFPGAQRPTSLFEAAGISSAASVHKSARLEDNVVVDPGAVIGPRAEIGAGTVIGSNAVIGAEVRIGRECTIGAGATIGHALIGDRVVVHPGCHIGQDGFGYVMEKGSHRKVPQVGRVIIQDDVEIGAGTTIDRGAIDDTFIGEGTKIDNLVQIGHNVTIGRHCILVSQVGVSGSVTLGDYVMMGGKAAVVDHITIGEGALVGAGAGVLADIPAGEKWIGYPAEPRKQWMRGVSVLRRAVRRSRGGKADTLDE